MASSDLTTLAGVKAWLGISADPGPSDDLLSQLITAVSAYVTDFLGRGVLTATYTEVYDGTGGGSLILRQAPVTSVQSVAFQGRILTTPADPVFGTPGFLFDGARLSLIGEIFPRGAPIVVAYTAGYDATPVGVEQAVIELVGEAFRRRERIGQSSKTLGGQETVAFSVIEMNPTARAMLAPHMAVAPV